MKFSKRLTFTFIVALMFLGASAAHAQWNPGRQCVPKGDSLECLFNSEMRGQSARVVIRNLKPDTTTVTWYEFHSVCGWPGGGAIQDDSALTVAGNATVPYRVLDPGRDITCRQVFLECSYAGSKTKCSDVISAAMESFVGNQQ